MICERCHKNPASVHMTQIMNGYKVERHLCEDCAKETGFGNAVSFQDIFKGFLGFTSPEAAGISNSKTANSLYKCPECGLTYEGFRKTGKLGCEKCYEAFKPQLTATLESIHGSNVHKGKLPKKNGGSLLIRKEKEDLKKKLAIAIAKEEFEEAAQLRDRIKEMEKKEGEQS